MDEEFQADEPPAQSAPAAMFAAGRWACKGRGQSEHRREGWQREVLHVSGLQASICSSQLSAFLPPNLPALLAPACQHRLATRPLSLPFWPHTGQQRGPGPSWAPLSRAARRTRSCRACGRGRKCGRRQRTQRPQRPPWRFWWTPNLRRRRSRSNRRGTRWVAGGMLPRAPSFVQCMGAKLCGLLLGAFLESVEALGFKGWTPLAGSKRPAIPWQLSL